MKFLCIFWALIGLWFLASAITENGLLPSGHGVGRFSEVLLGVAFIGTLYIDSGVDMESPDNAAAIFGINMETSDTGYDITPLTDEAIDRLAQDLSEEEHRILLNHGTEPAFCGTLLDNKMDGTYACRLCGLPLFSSNHKFESGTGWPSFYRPFDKEHLTNIDDNAYGMRRVEIRCARCGGHQGHVFPDGPPPTGQRYCLNSASLEFFQDGAKIPQKN